ncbi:hypothetical protein IWZ01DRAFT_567069 [Phyllosticta capitalensis]
MAAAKITFQAFHCTMDRCEFRVQACDAAGACKRDRFTHLWSEFNMAPAGNAAPTSPFWFYLCVMISVIVGLSVIKAHIKAMDCLARFLEPHAETREYLWPLYTPWVLPFAILGAVVGLMVILPLATIEEAAGLRPYVDAVFDEVSGLIMGVFDVWYECFPPGTCNSYRLAGTAVAGALSIFISLCISTFVRYVGGFLGDWCPFLNGALAKLFRYTDRYVIMAVAITVVLLLLDYREDFNESGKPCRICPDNPQVAQGEQQENDQGNDQESSQDDIQDDSGDKEQENSQNADQDVGSDDEWVEIEVPPAVWPMRGLGLL